MKILKSPINRFGGKYFLRKWLVEKMSGHTSYCEPFVGAGHLLFAKVPSKVEVINDIDNHLIEFFKVIQYPETRQALIDRLNHMPYSRALWQELRIRWKQGDIPINEIERAAMWFYLNKSCFGGDSLRGGFAGPSVTGRNPAQSFRTAIDGIDAVSRRLHNVTIEHLDYKECIRRYDSKDTLFYCDPPYLNTEHYYGIDNFTYDDHYGLAELLHVVKGKAMITHYQNGLYDDLYKGWYRHEYNTFKGSHKAKEKSIKPRVTEILYTNYETHEPLLKNR